MKKLFSLQAKNKSITGILTMILFISASVIVGCSGGGSSDSNDDETDYDLEYETSQDHILQEAKDAMDEAALAIRNIEREASVQNYTRLQKAYKELQNVCDNDDLFRADRNVAQEADEMAKNVKSILENKVCQIRLPLLSENDHLISETETNPIFLRKGEKLFIDFETQGNVTLRIYNADSHSVLKTLAGKKVVHDSLSIAHTAVYVVELKPVGEQYVDLHLYKAASSPENFSDKEVRISSEKVECTAKDFGAQKIQGIKLKNVFEEPRKVTLRSQGKALFSGGGDRSVVAMQVPTGCTDMAYSLRISTSQSDQSADGQFCKKMDEKYKKIKLLGLPLYESQGTSSNIFRELLNACEPYREEEAYCNLYIFTNSAEAKKFADGKPVTELKYNVDLSKQGTQSCNDRIPTKGIKTIYFGFENTRIRYSVYLWLESLATMPTTEYYRMTYKAAE